VISNHSDTREHADFYGVPFHLIPMTKDNKPRAEAQQLELLAANNIDVVVLARYMQVLSTDFITQYAMPIINIHHSFLPAFIGAKPHHQAYDRGVKLIGATAHYVTEILDDGPIIEQNITRISHRDSLEDLVEKGRDLEKMVLSRAVRWHIENRILLYNKKTIIFE
jgi:formyltetrahydrofolate deformylase